MPRTTPAATAPTTAGSSTGGESLSGTLNGGGASSQESAQGAWRAGFQSANSGVTVNYDPVGSGTGRENFISGAYAFAGSDSALSTDEGELDAANERCGGDVIEVPAYVSPIAVIYNLPGVEGLQLDAATIAQIFDGQITTWDDPAIADQNPDLDLPSTDITPVHRQDDSGTTDNFTDYLSQAGGGSWSYDPDGVWPIQGGEAAEGTSGLVAAVKAGEGTIGYADESQAGGLGFVSLKVGEEYVAPSAEAAAKVVAISPRAEGRGANDMAIEVDRTTDRVGCLPAHPAVVPHRLPDRTTTRTRPRWSRASSPTSCPRRARRPRPTRPAPRRSTPRWPTRPPGIIDAIK